MPADPSLTKLLRACSLLKYPDISKLKDQMVKLGPKTKTKLLILDMDETMLHTKFEPNNDKEMQPVNLENINGVLQFTVYLDVDAKGKSKGKSLKLNVKIRQHLEDVL